MAKTERSRLSRRGSSFITLMGALVFGVVWYLHIQRSTNSEIESSQNTERNLSASSAASVVASSARQGSSNPLWSSSQDLSDHSSKNADLPTSTIMQDAQALVDNGRVQEGLTQLQDLVQREPHNLEAMMEIAMIYAIDLKEPMEAKGWFERIIDLNPHHKDALSELILIVQDAGLRDEGIAFIDRKLHDAPDSHELQLAYGKLLADADPDKAMEYFKQSMVNRDLKGEALDLLATTALKAGHYAEAIQAWTMALNVAEAELELAKKQSDPGLDFLEDHIASTRASIERAKEQQTRQ